MKRTFSPDVLAANPDLAHKIKSSRAKTPSGKGRGFTDDAQHYAPVIADPNERLRTETKNYLGLVDWWTRRGVRDGVEVQSVVAACKRLMQMLEE